MVELFDFRKADVHLRAPAGTPLFQQCRQTVQRLRPKYQIDIGRTFDDIGTFLTGDAAADADQKFRTL